MYSVVNTASTTSVMLLRTTYCHGYGLLWYGWVMVWVMVMGRTRPGIHAPRATSHTPPAREPLLGYSTIKYKLIK
jgi:hypothetical protein